MRNLLLDALILLAVLVVLGGTVLFFGDGPDGPRVRRRRR